MSFYKKIIHQFIKYYGKNDHQYFIKNLSNMKGTQLKILSQTLSNLNENHPSQIKNGTYEQFKKLPITTYSDWAKTITREKESGNTNSSLCHNLKHYQPTSGSSHAIKWIPYNKEFISELDKSLNFWIVDLYNRYPKLKDGTHYWSMSWVPNDMRDKVKSNDANLFSPLKSFLLNKVFPVPEKVSMADTVNESLYQTVLYLINDEKLALISVWSPTFLLTLLNLIIKEKENILCENISHKQKRILEKIKSIEDIYLLWPNLTLISSWDTSSSALYAQEIKHLFPRSAFQGKGLWATEGVITIPFNDKHYLSYTSHFYEFEHLETHAILDSWELKIGDIVSPILTTANGILRYKLEDRLLVNSFDGDCPILEFIGRDQCIDLVGEKISCHEVSQVLKEAKATCLVAVKHSQKSKRPYYLLLTSECCEDYDIESSLQKNFHYKLARDIGQLAPAKTLKAKNHLELYQKLCVQKGMILGNIKPEFMITIESDELIND